MIASRYSPVKRSRQPLSSPMTKKNTEDESINIQNQHSHLSVCNRVPAKLNTTKISWPRFTDRIFMVTFLTSCQSFLMCVNPDGLNATQSDSQGDILMSVYWVWSVCWVKLPSVAVNGVWYISRVFEGFTWPSKVGVSVVPRVLVILEHIQTSGLQKKKKKRTPEFKSRL